MRQIRKTIGAFGHRIRTDLGLDQADFSSPVVGYEVKKPDGTTTTWAGTIVGGATEGHLVFDYIQLSADLDQRGVWILRPFGKDAAQKRYGEAIRILVAENYDA